MNTGKSPNVIALEQFHATGPARRDHDVEMPVLEEGDEVAYMGEIVAVVYRSDRKGKPLTYMHGFNDNVFEANKELLAVLTKIQNQRGADISGVPLYVLPDNRTFVFQAELTERGIEG